MLHSFRKEEGKEGEWGDVRWFQMRGEENREYCCTISEGKIKKRRDRGGEAR